MKVFMVDQGALGRLGVAEGLKYKLQGFCMFVNIRVLV